ncbi:MAG: hypothetical protein PHT54_01605 [Candidatus Nanoarchaeia archaeon]|nr:hypothetical protein [Candidatus Nanoarchaeia archaeon]
MGWKDALKPNGQKMALFSIFVLFSLIATFFGEWDIISKSFKCEFLGACAPPGFLQVIGAVLGAAPAILIVSYLLAAMFVHEEHIIKKSSKHKKHASKKTVKRKAKARGKKKK